MVGAAFSVALLLAATAFNTLFIQQVVNHLGPSDFSGYYAAVVRLLHGLGPYQQLPFQLVHVPEFVYPAVAAVVFAPFGVVSLHAGIYIYMMSSVCLMPLTLWLLGVRDWRVYAAVSLWEPFWLGWTGGNVSVQFTFLLAVIWRVRERPPVVGLLTALGISVKPYFWPVLVFLAATRRWRATGWALAWGLAFNLVAWAIVGPAQIVAYVHTTSYLTGEMWREAYGVMAIGYYLDLGHHAAQALWLCAIVAGAVLVARRALGGDAVGALAATVVLVLVAAPITWSHYFIMLAVPLAVARPRLSLLWLVPLVMWWCPPAYPAEAWQVALAWLATAGAVIPIVWPLGDEPRHGWRALVRQAL